jgi:hypothetical protein
MIYTALLKLKSPNLHLWKIWGFRGNGGIFYCELKITNYGLSAVSAKSSISPARKFGDTWDKGDFGD